MLRPVCVLEVPNCPLLPCEEVLHLQACSSVATRVCAEARCDLKPSIGDGVMPGPKSWPVPKALLPSTLLLKTSTVKHSTRSSKSWPFIQTACLKFRTTSPPCLFPWRSGFHKDQHELLFFWGWESQLREMSAHLFCCHHSYNCNALFPYHLPKILTSIL